MMFTRDKFISPREKSGKGHVSPVMSIFPKGGASSPRYIVISPRYKFISPKDMVGNKPFFFKGGGCKDGKACEVYHST